MTRSAARPAAAQSTPPTATPTGTTALTDERPWSSRQLHRVNDLSASSGATGLAAAVSAFFLLVALTSRHPSVWLTIFQSIAAAVTLVMVFALQHTQVRHQAAMQRKLDEILAAIPGADTRLVHVETATQAELDALDERHGLLRDEALGLAPDVDDSAGR